MAKTKRTTCNKEIIYDGYTGRPVFDDSDDVIMDWEDDTTNTTPKSIIGALDIVLENVHHSKLSRKFFENSIEAFGYLDEHLGITPMQCVVIAMLVDSGKPLCWREMARFAGVSRLSFMRFYEEVEQLVTRRWLLHYGARDTDSECGYSDGYKLVYGVITALRQNRPFVPEKLQCENTKQFIERMADRIKDGQRDNLALFADDLMWLKSLILSNQQLPIAQKLGAFIEQDSDLGILALTITDYVYYGGTDTEGMDYDTIERIALSNLDRKKSDRVQDELESGTHCLMVHNLIQHQCEDGFACTWEYVLTDFAKREVLEGYVPKIMKRVQQRSMVADVPGLVSCKKIKEKQLFYNAKEQEQIDRLSALLSKDQFPLVQKRLESKGMRKGFACLLYGGPGTGKTATAYELARQTGRDIISVSVTQFKDKYVGESEKKLREIFKNYRTLCQSKRITPILLMNEADSIISKRMENVTQSVDQMNNSLQNILLEELENLEGILIATTNLTSNMDTAFERRFLFKIEFNKPDIDTRSKIWTSMIPELSSNDALRLSRKYDFSGGEMENISRKATVEFIINGTAPTYEQIDLFCSQERLVNRKTMASVIGFAS